MLALVRSGLDPRVTPPRVASAQVATQCRTFTASLPSVLGSYERRGTRPHSELTAAYGTPAITVRCGVVEPKPTGDYDCRRFGDQDWLVVPRRSDSLFLTFGTSPAVEVVVPDDYQAPPLEGLSGPASRLPRNGLACPDPG
ncbi:uncharacterized protein DUF3515 [Motilibacter peucedani]|uniref:Uncharacterized protein DUF3515 n=1 Tax=Motilibacter peucedani TaxID=598650 RepID=A0A420XUU3_9ACTN|nr:uncharacterized protein DUF3515 [Motilibacter peucedani]